MSEQPPNRIGALDGFRAVAILLVLGFHWGPRWSEPWTTRQYLPWDDLFSNVWILQYGRSHACFFFILSGFVILLTLERCRSFTDFFRKRVARLWPTLVLCAALSTAALAAFGPAEWLKGPLSFALSVLMIDPAVLKPLMPGANLGWVDGAYWTLGVEARFYLLAGLVFLLGRGRFLPAWLILQTASFALGTPTLMQVEALDPLRLVLMPVWLPYLTLGICLYEIWRARGWPPLATFGAIAAVAMILLNAAFWSRFAHEDSLGRTLVNVGWISLFVLFVLNSPLIRPFGWKPLTALGAASYPLFLLHEAGGIALMRPLAALGLHPLIVLLIVFALMICIALMIFRFFEEPAKNLILGATAPLVVRSSQTAPWLDYGRTQGSPASVSDGRTRASP